jgi:hypothetical protein
MLNLAASLILFAMLLLGGAMLAVRRIMSSTSRRSNREDARLVRLNARKLAGEARVVIRRNRWERFPSGARIVSQEEWKDAELLTCLESLYLEALQETPTDFGTSGNMFVFYDTGLRTIVEVLQKRTA